MSNGVLESKRQNASNRAPKMKKDSEVGNNLPPVSEEVLTLLTEYWTENKFQPVGQKEE
jgi:hypothetical protein